MLDPSHADVWLAFGLCLLAIEVATSTVFLLGPGLAALIIGGAVYLFPQLGLVTQLGAFALLSLALTPACRLAARRWRSKDEEVLNDRAQSYVGRRVTVIEGFEGGRGRVLLDGVPWTAESLDAPAPRKGDSLHVVAVNGALLEVGAAPPARDGS